MNWLCYEIESAKIERAKNVLVCLLRGYNNHRCWNIVHQPAQEAKAVHERHFQIESNQIGPEADRLLESVLAVCCSIDHLHIRNAFQNFRDDLPAECRIIHNQNLNHGFFFVFSFESLCPFCYFW